MKENKDMPYEYRIQPGHGLDIILNDFTEDFEYTSMFGLKTTRQDILNANTALHAVRKGYYCESGGEKDNILAYAALHQLFGDELLESDGGVFVVSLDIMELNHVLSSFPELMQLPFNHFEQIKWLPVHYDWADTYECDAEGARLPYEEALGNLYSYAFMNGTKFIDYLNAFAQHSVESGFKDNQPIDRNVCSFFVRENPLVRKRLSEIISTHGKERLATALLDAVNDESERLVEGHKLPMDLLEGLGKEYFEELAKRRDVEWNAWFRQQKNTQ